jgi:hypothetical protein
VVQFSKDEWDKWGMELDGAEWEAAKQAMEMDVGEDRE